MQTRQRRRLDSILKMQRLLVFLAIIFLAVLASDDARTARRKVMDIFFECGRNNDYKDFIPHLADDVFYTNSWVQLQGKEVVAALFESANPMVGLPARRCLQLLHSLVKRWDICISKWK